MVQSCLAGFGVLAQRRCAPKACPRRARPTIHLAAREDPTNWLILPSSSPWLSAGQGRAGQRFVPLSQKAAHEIRKAAAGFVRA